MKTDTLKSRRRFLCVTGSLAAGFALPLVSSTALAAEKKEAEEKESDVGSVEDLMREHGLLRRVLLIYEEIIRRLDAARDLPPGVVSDSAGIIRRFVEDYHEKLLEEDELFPRFRKAGKHVDLVNVLYEQHQAGRRLTDIILKLSAPGIPTTAEAKKGLSSALQAFILMYRPHAAREDTVLFPVLRSIVSPKEFHELGEKFEDREQELFGKEGFEKMVDSVGEIEKKLSIFDLSQFTPKV